MGVVIGQHGPTGFPSYELRSKFPDPPPLTSEPGEENQGHGEGPLRAVGETHRASRGSVAHAKSVATTSPRSGGGTGASGVLLSANTGK